MHTTTQHFDSQMQAKVHKDHAVLVQDQEAHPQKTVSFHEI